MGDFKDDALLGIEKICEGVQLLNRGPLKYSLERLSEYTQALFTRFAPFRIGDSVVLTTTPDCKNDWSGSAHFLKAGAVGKIHDVDYRNGRFGAGVVFDAESWIDDKGVVHPVGLKNRHTYFFWENEISRTSTTQPENPK